MRQNRILQVTVFAHESSAEGLAGEDEHLTLQAITITINSRIDIYNSLMR